MVDLRRDVVPGRSEEGQRVRPSWGCAVIECEMDDENEVLDPGNGG